MSLSELSTSNQNYLKIIWGLQEWTADPVTTSGLAAKAGVKLSSASDAVRKLAEKGLLSHNPYSNVELTAEGRKYALAMVRRHRLIEMFLVEVLGCGWDEVHDEAESLEHAVSDALIDRIDAQLGFPKRDPHGDPIPSAAGEVELPDASPISDFSADSSVTVERISDADSGLLQFFAERGIGIGSVLTLRAAAPYSEAIEVETPRGRISLGPMAAAAVWVSAT